MLKQIKKTLGILLLVCFLMSVTAVAVSAGPVMVKDKKTVIVVMKDVKNINTSIPTLTPVAVHVIHVATVTAATESLVTHVAATAKQSVKAPIVIHVATVSAAMGVSCHKCSSNGETVCKSPNCHTCSHGQCCNGVSCHKCSSNGETVCEC